MTTGVSTVTTGNVARGSARRVKYGERGRDPYDALRFWSAATHGAGAAAAVVGTIWLLLRARGGAAVAACAVYGLSMILLYTASGLYHRLRLAVRGRILLRKLDHASICLLIAGTYTPLCVLALNGVVGTALLAAVWALALGGVAMSVFWIGAPRWLSTAVYLVMGWMALFAIRPLYLSLNAAEFFWLLAGGVFYSLGGVLYALKWPGRYNPRFGCHEIFHLFVLAGSVCHYLMIRLIVL